MCIWKVVSYRDDFSCADFPFSHMLVCITDLRAGSVECGVLRVVGLLFSVEGGYLPNWSFVEHGEATRLSVEPPK